MDEQIITRGRATYLEFIAAAINDRTNLRVLLVNFDLRLSAANICLQLHFYQKRSAPSPNPLCSDENRPDRRHRLSLTGVSTRCTTAAVRL